MSKEKIEDVVSEMRGRSEDGRIDRALWANFADRIEAFVRAAEPKRTAWTPRAARTPARRSADESPAGRLCRSLSGVAGTSMCRSMRSSSGPEIFAR